MLDLVEPLVGPDIALWTSHFISKDPFVGRATPWHEDSAFWEGRLSDYTSIVTVWLALSPSNRENGCMRVIPGTHLNGGFSDNYVPTDMTVQTFHAEISEVPEDKAVYFELAPGESSLHDGRIVHGAAPNTGSVRRTGYTMRYFPASVKVLPGREERRLEDLARPGRGLRRQHLRERLILPSPVPRAAPLSRPQRRRPAP